MKTMTTTNVNYVAHHNNVGSPRFPRGWYALKVIVANDNKVTADRSAYFYSKRSRGEAVSKLVKHVNNNSSMDWIHMNNLTCVDHLVDSKTFKL